MDDITFVWRILDALARNAQPRDPVALATLKWMREEKKTLKLRLKKEEKLGWKDIAGHAAAHVPGEAGPLQSQCAQIACALQLDAVDAALLQFLVACDRSAPVRSLAAILTAHRIEPTLFWAQQLCAQPAEARARLTRGDLERFGLINLKLSRDGLMEVEPSWRLNNLLSRAMAGADEDLAEMLVGRRQKATLSLDRFGRMSGEAHLVARLIRGAIARKAAGINILFFGPPGTGKTELARSVAQAAGGQLFSVGEADEYDDEPNRWDRVAAYRMAQRVAARRAGTVLLFDEMEDLIGDAQPAGDSFRGREGSKIFVNRLHETNAAPTIWTTNALGNIDPAILRRMSSVLKFDHASPSAALAMLEHIAAEEKVEIGDSGLRTFAQHMPASAAVMRNALRTGDIAGGGEVDAVQAAAALHSAVRGGEKLRLPKGDAGAIDLSLFECDRDIAALVGRLTAQGAPADFSLLLTGPPGTGKTALAHHLAQRLDRPLIVKRAADLLSKWVGETEKQIANAFAEALDRNGVLLFDEVDSLLLDRATARQSWEVTQVNELLTRFDDHPLPFIATTNHATKLDPAALRRFVFKLEFAALSADRRDEAYRRYFGGRAPAALAALDGLTPGDFAVVARQMRYGEQPARCENIVAALEAELRAKPGRTGRIGF